jgi:LL-diaminopimelate aminotransferase
MIRINENYLKLKSSYLFSDIAKKVSAYQAAHPDKPIIRLGIGDVTCPLPPACIEALHAATDEMAVEASFRGYGPEQGYDFLREKIVAHDFGSRGVKIESDEIFVSDGSKCDTGNFQELFSQDIRIAIPDPVYPVYIDTNVMAGRTGFENNGRYDKVLYLDSTRENGFVPAPPKEAVDLVYLCFPNNPTGAVATREQLKAWVEYAHTHRAVLLYDAAYEVFIQDPSIPHSIYEIDGAKEVAVEFRSYSKNAGFTGLRCAYTVVPKECKVYDTHGNQYVLNQYWNRRHCTKFNGVSYPVQRAAEAVYSPAGARQVKELAAYYMENARLIRSTLTRQGYSCSGGENGPYVWVDAKMGSWEFFDLLLNKVQVVCTPGVGFGRCGEGFVRISAFNSRDKVEAALQRIATL